MNTETGQTPPQLTIAELSALTKGGVSKTGALHVQFASRASRQTKTNKSFYKVAFKDEVSEMELSVFDNHPAFAHAGRMEPGTCVVLFGNWFKGDYGVESADWTMRVMTDEERAEFFCGSPELREKQRKDFEQIQVLVHSMTLDSPYRALIVNFLSANEPAFRRAAAASGNHHARRGGLVEHVSYMMRAADALGALYREVLPVNRDLLLCGTFFHDVGKLWENQYPEQGFAQDASFDAQALGHIAIGCGLVSSLWAKLPTMEKSGESVDIAQWSSLRKLRILQHLILSHHGTMEWGSPVVPKCPEAVILHFVDNCDAKIEMLRGCYATSERLGDGVVKKVFPMDGHALEVPL